MIENNRMMTIISHLVLVVGLLTVALPLWIAFVASTHGQADLVAGRIPILPGEHFIENWSTAITSGLKRAGGVPVGLMLINSLIMAIGIAVGKIAISIISAYAIVYFRFPLRMVIFWMIFLTLMLPVEVRILPTFEVAANLNLLDSYTGLTVPLIASATATFLVPPVLLDRSRRTDGSRPHGRRRPPEVLQGHPAAPVVDKYCRAVCHPVHLWMEPISVAAAHHDR